MLILKHLKSILLYEPDFFLNLKLDTFNFLLSRLPTLVSKLKVYLHLPSHKVKFSQMKIYTDDHDVTDKFFKRFLQLNVRESQWRSSQTKCEFRRVKTFYFLIPIDMKNK